MAEEKYSWSLKKTDIKKEFSEHPIAMTISAIITSPAMPVLEAMQLSHDVTKKIAHKSWSKLSEEEKHPALKLLADQIDDNEKAAQKELFKDRPDGKASVDAHNAYQDKFIRLAEAKILLDKAYGDINQHLKEAERLATPAMSRAYAVKDNEDSKQVVFPYFPPMGEGWVKLKTGNHVLNDAKDHIEAVNTGLSNAIRLTLAEYSDGKYDKEFAALMGTKVPNQIVVEKFSDIMAEKVEKAASSQVTLGYLDPKRSDVKDMVPFSIEEQAKRAVSGSGIKLAPEGGLPAPVVGVKATTTKKGID